MTERKLTEEDIKGVKERYDNPYHTNCIRTWCNCADVPALIHDLELERAESNKLKVEKLELDIAIEKILEEADVQSQRDEGERAKLIIEVGRLREALEYYADPDNWKGVGMGIAKVEAEDQGEKAQAALEEPTP